MVEPVKNILCGQVYDKHSMESLLIYRCSVEGCHQVKRNLQEDSEIKRSKLTLCTSGVTTVQKSSPIL